MDVRCPFCSKTVVVATDATEVECPVCRASFDVEAARLMEETTDSGGRSKATEAWLRDEDSMGPAGDEGAAGEAATEALGSLWRPGRSTETYVRKPGAGDRAGTYRLRGEDIPYPEEEVFVRPLRKSAEPSGRPAAGATTAPRPGASAPVGPPVSPQKAVSVAPARPGGPVVEDEGPAQLVRRAEQATGPGPRGESDAGAAARPGEARAIPTDEPFRTLDAEPAFDRFSWVGPEFPPGPPAGEAGPSRESASKPSGPAGMETRKESFLFLGRDVGPASGSEGLRSQGPAPRSAGVGAEDANIEPLGLSFEDLSLPEPPGGEAGGSPLDGLDIESVLGEESEPEAVVPWRSEASEVGQAASVGVAPPGRVASAPDAGWEGGSEVEGPAGPVAGQALGLPDQWLDLPEDRSEPPSVEPLLGLDLEGFPGGDGTRSDRGLRPDLAIDLGEAPAVPSREAVAPARPPQGAAPRSLPRGRAGTTGMRAALLGVFLVVVVGVILGQTEYGYFGFNLFVPSDESLATGRRAVPPPGMVVGIARDTPEAYRSEIARLEQELQDDPDNVRVKADLLEVMMRLRERFPAVAATDEKLEGRIKQLAREVQVTGQKASLVRVLDLVNAGQFAQARAVLDGMVVATAQDADVLYFYGKIALGQGKFEEAQKYFELALMKNPASIAVKYFLARTRVSQGDAGEGRRLLEEIVTQEPGHLASKVLLAQMALRDRDVEGAARLAREVVLKADSQAYAQELFDAHLVLAGVHEVQGNPSEVTAEMKAALALRPTHQETAVALARRLLAEDKKDEAVTVLEPCWKEGCDSLEFLATYLEAVLASGQEQRAAEIMARGTEKYPNAPDFALIQGRYLLAMERPRAAATAFESAIAAAPEVTEAYLSLAEALVRDGKFAQAVRRLQEGVDRVRDRIPVLMRIAALQKDMRDFVAAEETLRQVLVVDPSATEAQERLGLVVLALGRTEEAVAVLGALHARQALSREGVLGLARAYLMMHKPGKAREVLAKVYGKVEEDPVVATEYGRALAESGQVREAEGIIKKVLDERPSFAPAHHVMGKVLALKGETKAAMEHLVRAVQIDPRDTRYRLDLARMLKKHGTDEAIRDALIHLDHVVKAYQQGEVPVEERQADAYVLRGEILFGQQKFAAAMKDFEAALALEPARMDILVGYGRALYEMARYNEAAPYFRQVLGRDRTHPDANFYLGQILLREGKVEEAKTLFERVAQRSPERHPESLRLLGLIYRDQNLKPLARRSFAAYLEHAPKGSAEAEEVRRILDKMR